MQLRALAPFVVVTVAVGAVLATGVGGVLRSAPQGPQAADAAGAQAALSTPPGAELAAELLHAPGDDPLVAAHRGASWAAPENTLAAMQEAVDAGAAFLETDVLLTSDGVPVLMHDSAVDRTTTGSGLVSWSTLDQIRALDAGSWFAPRFAGERVPTLDEFLALGAAADVRLLIEFKGEYTPEELRSSIALIHEHGLDDRVVVQSFSSITLRSLQAEAPELPRMVLTRTVPADAVATAREYDAIGVNPPFESASRHPEYIAELHDAGLLTFVFTVDDPADWRTLTDLGADAILTDRAAALRAWLR